jgi:hypothetical protein
LHQRVKALPISSDDDASIVTLRLDISFFSAVWKASSFGGSAANDGLTTEPADRMNARVARTSGVTVFLEKCMR